jgi:RimJ/RimL family protein N-acetyltransferase
MIEIKEDKRGRVGTLFQGYKWNYLADAILDGYIGSVFADRVEDPQVGVLEVPKIKIKILGGDAGHPSAREYIEGLPLSSVLIFASDDWDELVETVHAGRMVHMPRFAFTSESLDIERLRTLITRVPEGYRLLQMDLSLAQKLAAEKSEFASDHMLIFESPEDFITHGFGFCIMEGDEIISAATTFAVCDKGIEIQINTRDKHQGKGLATVVAAQIMVYSLENGLDPNWDAANDISVGLAKKLGYTPQGSYLMYFVLKSRWKATLAKVALKVKAILRK